MTPVQGILFHRITDIDSGTSARIVLPKCRREKVLRLSHDGLGHLSTKKVRHFLNARFTWPYIARDVENYCRSCLRCQQTNKNNNKKSRMVPRPVINVPFESVALDIVGPLPKGKKGSWFLLTYVLCLASRWPEVVPLKGITAEKVAEALVEILLSGAYH